MQEETKNSKKPKILKIILLFVSSVIVVLFAAYVIFLVSIDALHMFGQPFRIKYNRVYFGPCECPEGQRLHCGITADPYSRCECEEKYDSSGSERPFRMDKPIIYLYPESELAVNVKLGNPDFLTTTYPKYPSNGWDVIAYPNGDLIERNTNKKLYSLYWEGERTVSNVDYSTGFMVPGADSAAFLEEKLALLGLNYRETEEFILYWLPKLEANPYNYIYFMSSAEIEQEMPIIFSTEPDTEIRVRMVFKGLDEYQEVHEQILEEAPVRTGFTVVEWGGTELVD